MVIKNFAGMKTFYGINIIELGPSPAPHLSPKSETVWTSKNVASAA